MTTFFSAIMFCFQFVIIKVIMSFLHLEKGNYVADREIEKIIDEFFQEVGNKKIEIYNEFSLQHELGIFFRNSSQLKNKKIQFERNVKDFHLDEPKGGFIKKEIDITIFTEPKNDSWCRHKTKDLNDDPRPENLSYIFELKYPRNGQYPESMFSFCKDIAFLEQVVGKEKFKKGYFIAVASDPLFYKGGKTKEGIYKFFRTQNNDNNENINITGEIPKPTGSGGKPITIHGSYKAEWKQIKDDCFYCIIEIV